MSFSHKLSGPTFPIWLVVLSAAAIAGLGMGLRQVIGLYLNPVTLHLGVGREDFALSVAISNIIWGIAAPFVGAVSDRYGVSRVVVFGVLTTVIGLMTLCYASTVTHLLISGLFLGLGIAGAGINAMVGAVGRVATEETRTQAIATVGMGSGIGILLALPYTHLLIGQLGWQTSLLVLSATCCLAFLLIPIVTGGNAPVVSKNNALNQTDQSLQDALREAIKFPSFWLLNGGFFVCGFHVVFYGVHLPAYVSDQGLSPQIAVWGLVAVGIGNLIGTYVAGQWGRVFPKRYGLALIYLGRAGVFLGFLFLPITGFTVLMLSSILGLLWLSTIPLTSGLVATFFGPKWMTMLYGIVFFFHQIGSFFGVWLGGVVFDQTQSYDVMWWGSVALGLLAALVHLPIVEEPSAPRVVAPV